MKNVITRSISGAVYVALIILAIVAGRYGILALTAVLALLAGIEYHQLVAAKGGRKAVTAAINTVDIVVLLLLQAASFTLTQFYLGSFFAFSVALVVFIAARFVLALYDKRPEAFAEIGRSVLGYVYIGLPIGSLNLLGMFPEAFWFTLAMFVMIWLNDTGAFCVGSLFGRRKLFERLSPKKSWEGFWGGMLFCALAGVVFYYIADSSLPLGAWIGLGVTVSVISTWGDLFESMMKRSLGVKDSGKLIPGHGGILDRIDSLLFVAPVTVIYLMLLLML